MSACPGPGPTRPSPRLRISDQLGPRRPRPLPLRGRSSGEKFHDRSGGSFLFPQKCPDWRRSRPRQAGAGGKRPGVTRVPPLLRFRGWNRVAPTGPEVWGWEAPAGSSGRGSCLSNTLGKKCLHNTLKILKTNKQTEKRARSAMKLVAVLEETSAQLRGFRLFLGNTRKEKKKKL